MPHLGRRLDALVLVHNLGFQQVRRRARVFEGGLDPALEGVELGLHGRLGSRFGVVSLDDLFDVVGRVLGGGLGVQQGVHLHVGHLQGGPVLGHLRGGGEGLVGACVWRRERERARERERERER